MVPWLWEEKLDIGRLTAWLDGRGLPPVGRDEEPYHWLLRGIAIPDAKAREFLERRLAERLAIVLGEEPDVHPLAEGDAEEFLVNLYWTCAGLNRPTFLAEQLWQAYKRLRVTRPLGAVRDALQAAMVQNQFGETKPLKEIWEPMVEKGRHPWLRGNEVVGFEGILARHRTVKPDIEKIFWALGRISERWDESRREDFELLLARVNQRGDVPDLRGSIERYIDGWSSWARAVVVPVTGAAMQSESRDSCSVRTRVDEQIILNKELTDLGQFATASLIRGIAHALILRRILRANRPISRT
jgi:hypothetical protein